MLELQLPTLITVLATAAIDSINPCAIGVLILMVSVILSSGGTRRRLLFLGGLYIFAVFATYLIAGLGLAYFFSAIPRVLSEYISIAVALIIVGAGILEIKDYFWYGRGLSLAIPARYAKRIHEFSKRATAPGVIFLGIFVSAVELPCTGAPYLAIIAILSQNFDFAAFLMMVLYNIVFVAPLLIILGLVAVGVEIPTIKFWKQASRAHVRLLIGITLVALGWLLMLIANGTIHLG